MLQGNSFINTVQNWDEIANQISFTNLINPHKRMVTMMYRNYSV